jgi:hypothetical protein
VTLLFRRRRFRRTYIKPTRAALKGALGDAPFRLRVSRDLGGLMTRLSKPMSPAELAVRRWYGQNVEPVLRWPGDQMMRGAWKVQQAAAPVTRHVVKLRRPREVLGPRVELYTRVPYLTAEQRSHISAIVSAKIPASDLVERWNQVGPRVCATWTVRRRPPAKCGYADLDARLPGLEEWEFFLGLGVDAKPVVVSLHDDSPHLALSAGSGAGKSVLAQLVGVQVLARGGWVVILDRKGSHRWALGLAGVDYCTTAEQMHNALVRLATLADERNTLAFHEDEGWDPGPRVLVIAEELNATFSQLRDHWDAVRAKGDAKVSPAVKAFRNLLFMGRSAKVNVLAVAQMLTAQTTGGPETRENFGIRCLARYTANNWKMLAPEAAMPRASRVLGRWQIVTGGVATETQVCFLTAAQARLLVAKMSPTSWRPGDFSQVAPIKGDSAPAGTSGTPEDLVTLRQAVDRGLMPWQFDAAKKRMQRSATTPAPAGKDGNAHTYRVDELIVWIESELVA